MPMTISYAPQADRRQHPAGIDLPCILDSDLKTMGQERAKRRLAAILAADVAGYSRLMWADEAGTVAAMHQVWADRVEPVVVAHGGRFVKVMGDGALIEFASAVEAVQCAIDVQLAMAEHNRGRSEKEIEFRIGVNLGDVIVEGDDIFGDGINVAARLEGEAPKNGILLCCMNR